MINFWFQQLQFQLGGLVPDSLYRAAAGIKTDQEQQPGESAAEYAASLPGTDGNGEENEQNVLEEGTSSAIKKPQENSDFQGVSANEADGNRTRNLRIDSPML